MKICPGCYVTYMKKAIVNQTQEIIQVCDICDCVMYQENEYAVYANFAGFMEERGLPVSLSELTIPEHEEDLFPETEEQGADKLSDTE